MTARLQALLADVQIPTPCLVMDVQQVADNYREFRQTMPDMAVYYAVKANPDPSILALLVAEGASFDCASYQEIEMVRAVGAEPNRISYNNTIKKAADIAKAYAAGVRQFAFDAEEELAKIAAHAPGADVTCRLLIDDQADGAQWPLSRKFGCDDQMAMALLGMAAQLGLTPRGISFHVGSQQTNIDSWDHAIGRAAALFRGLAKDGIHLDTLNLGGGFPTAYGNRNMPAVSAYATSIAKAISRHFDAKPPHLIVEPGRALVGNAGVIVSEVVLVSRKTINDDLRWVYLDVGRFQGLAETEAEAIRYPITVPARQASACTPAIIAGPTCDSVDTLYERNPVAMPDDLAAGDIVWVHDTGAYTATYSSVGFNGFAPLQVCLLDDICAKILPIRKAS